MQTPYKAVYVGHVMTPHNVPLYGKIATIHHRFLPFGTEEYILHALFDDPELGRYHKHTHRFREEEFNKHIEHHTTEFSEHGRIHFRGWYFRDETGGLYGPYDAVDLALQAHEAYCKQVLGEHKI